MGELEHVADDQKRTVPEALTEAFTTPLDPEDVFELSQGLDGILNRAGNTVREAEVMGRGPMRRSPRWPGELAESVRNLAAAVDGLAHRHGEGAATDAADRAIKNQRHLEHAYRSAMSSADRRRGRA